MSRFVRGLQRLAVAAVVVLAGVVLLSAAIGAAAHYPVQRAVSLGLYAVGALLLALGFFHGVRPPVRIEGERGQAGMFGVLFSRGMVRGASPEEQQDALSSSALFVGLGVLLIVAGALLDPDHRLV